MTYRILAIIIALFYGAFIGIVIPNLLIALPISFLGGFTLGTIGCVLDGVYDF
jgi:hypothetical protein